MEVENSLGNLWSLRDFTNPGYLGTWQQFTNQFIHPIRLDNDRRRAVFLKKITAPLLLRRRKSDKLDLVDMPDRIEHRQYAPLIAEQAALYQNLAVQGLRAVFDEKDGQRRQAIALKLLIALKQVCNHPYQYLKKGSTIPDLSGKVELLLCLLDNIYENGEKTLILTQFQETGELLARFIQDEFGKRPLFLHGGTGRPEREEMLEIFRQNPDFDTLILSVKSGNSELDFTTASHLIHFDSWWNPALEALATRIGLSDEVMTWRLITEGSLEEKIDEMLRQQKDLASLTAATGENWLGNLSDKELSELVEL